MERALEAGFLLDDLAPFNRFLYIPGVLEEAIEDVANQEK